MHSYRVGKLEASVVRVRGNSVRCSENKSVGSVSDWRARAQARASVALRRHTKVESREADVDLARVVLLLPGYERRDDGRNVLSGFTALKWYLDRMSIVHFVSIP